MATRVSKKGRSSAAPTDIVNLAALQNNRRVAAVTVVGIAAIGGLLVAFLVPRGPSTAGQGLAVLFGCLLIGLLAGLLWPQRLTLLVAPVAHIVAIELGRFGADGPTVDLPRLDNTYGILALLLGRGFYALLGLLPMMIGVGYGAALANRQPAGAGLRIRQGLGAVILLGLVVLIALPAKTPPILGSDDKPLPGSIAELTTVKIGGHDQALLIRGQNIEKPVILYLSGGPGQSSLPHPRVIFEDLERDFIVVSWDQRGTGKSYAGLDPTGTLTLDRAVSDAVEVTNYLRQRFDEDKIYILGESWGTILGVLAVQRNPELYYAFIGSGQMVSVRETDRRLYADVLALAKKTGDTQLEQKMLDFGEPPYADTPYPNAFVMGYYEQLYTPYTPPQSYIERGSTANLGAMGLMGSEYNFIEKANVLRGLLDMFTVMYPQIQEVDFRQDATRLGVPVYMLDGTAELAARRDLALEWFGMLEAPRKEVFHLDNAAHAVAFEQYEAFHKILLESILPETYPKTQ